MIKKLYFGLLLILITSLLTFTGSSVVAHDDSAVSSANSLIGQIQLNEDNSTESEDEEDEKDEEDDDNDGVENEKESAYEREIEIEIDDEKFIIESTLKNDTNKDKFDIEFDVGTADQAEIKLKFETEAGSNETELEYRVKFDEIIEFTDENVPGYQNETLLTRYEIGKVGWLPLEHTNNVSSGLITINATTVDGVFSLILRMSNTFMNDENATLSSNSLKIDVLINNFPFATTGSKLAVKALLKTESDMNVDDESEDELEGIASNETEVGITSASASGFFSWSDLAEVDGVIVDVLTSALSNSTADEGEPSSMMYYTFNATDPVNIVWDPKIGVVSEAAKSLYKAIVDPPVTSSSSTSETSTVNTSTSVAESKTEESSDDGVPGFEIWVFFSLVGLVFAINRKKLTI